MCDAPAVMHRFVNMPLKKASHFWGTKEIEFMLTLLHDMSITQYTDDWKQENGACEWWRLKTTTVALKRLDFVMQTSDCDLQINIIFGNNHITGARVNTVSVGEFIWVYNK